MDTNEAPTALLAGDNPSVADVFYCASLLRVSPTDLLSWVIEQLGEFDAWTVTHD